MGVGDRLRQVISSKYPVLKDFSEASGVNYRTLQHYLSEERTVSTAFLEMLTSTIGASASWVLTGAGPMILSNDDQIAHTDQENFFPIPRFSIEASAGPGTAAESEETTGFYAFNQKWLARRGLNPANLAVIAVRGDSMEPKLAEGDLILIDRAQRQIADGRAFVLRIDSDLLVKHIQRIGPGTISLISANRLYPPREVAIADLDGDCNQIEIIGRVVASMHEW